LPIEEADGLFDLCFRQFEKSSWPHR
jgi:hypothetical protein